MKIRSFWLLLLAGLVAASAPALATSDSPPAAQSPAAAGEASTVEAEAIGAPSLDDARDPIERFYSALLDAAKQGATLGTEGRRTLLDPVVKSVYDLEFMASRVLGRHWRALGEAEQDRWIETFAELTVSTWAARFPEHAGEAFEVGSVETGSRETAVVHTEIVPSSEEAVEIRYRLRAVDGEWRVIDVYLNGTVSELALRRSEYSAVIKRDGFEHLEQTLREKIEKGESI